MRRRSLFLVHLALGLLLPGSLLAQPRGPEVIGNALDCNAFINFMPKRQRCLSCVASRGRFWNRGEGRCDMAPPPPPPDVFIRSPRECGTLIMNPEKRRRCFECVRVGNTFQKQYEGYGACIGRPAPPPPPPPPPAYERQLSPGDCATQVHNPEKRHRCMMCVRQGGVFFRHGAGGAGSCTLAAPPPPPPPPPVITSVPDCFSQIAHPGQRHHCRKCVTHGGAWDLRGFCRR